MLPTNNLVGPMLTDMYQLTMAYAYNATAHLEDHAVFDLFFRKNPFGGEFTIYAGLEEVLDFVENFHFSEDDIRYLKSEMPGCSPDFFKWLHEVDCSQVKIHAFPEGSVVFPREPLLRVEGPLGVCQLLETTMLNLTGYASLVATNAARLRLAAGEDKTLLEFGLRRAQGPDGGLSASKFAYLGGFDATSNMLAGKLFVIPVRGTHAHSFVQSSSGLSYLQHILADPFAKDLVDRAFANQKNLGLKGNRGELCAFIAYAYAFPKGFLALVDTYDTLKSGVPNFICVALALKEMGHNPVGIRLDSGDLAYLSMEARRMMDGYGLQGCKIAASNDINEEVLLALKEQGHAIDIFGIGTHLVTCQAQPALGCVYKLVEIDGKPRIKLSDNPEKTTLPGEKEVYRLIGKDGLAILDLMIEADEEEPRPNAEVLCRHPFIETKRVRAIPTEVLKMHDLVWNGAAKKLPPLPERREYCRNQLALLRPDHLRLLNPTPYKVSVSGGLYDYLHRELLEETPITIVS